MLVLQLWTINSSLTQLTSDMASSSLPVSRVCSLHRGVMVHSRQRSCTVHNQMQVRTEVYCLSAVVSMCGQELSPVLLWILYKVVLSMHCLPHLKNCRGGLVILSWSAVLRTEENVIEIALPSYHKAEIQMLLLVLLFSG